MLPAVSYNKYQKGLRAMRQKNRKNSIIRAIFVAISVMLQISWLLLLVLKLNQYSTYISLITGALAFLAVLRLYSRDMAGAYKMPWIMLILVFPVMGLSLYLLTEVAVTRKSVRRRMGEVRNQIGAYLCQNPDVMTALEGQNFAVANQFRYLSLCENSPVYCNTSVKHYSSGALALADLKEDLEQAKEFIFMEYFIVEDGDCFRELREILVRKAREGVDVRLMYDDIGSVGYVNWRFARELNAQGIRCQVFNPALPILNLFLNNRDHRKITVIDGKVGYTGGYNLADEYFGKKELYGRWKDTGIRLEGEAVRSLTASFLELWTLTGRGKEDYGRYLNVCHSVPSEGYVQPFGDNPMDQEHSGENMYIHMINHAAHSLWIMTPYLIITDELSRALELAAKRGVDVRIITPGIPDKRAVYAVTRSYYAGLVKGGVRIFEYTPGFLHAKQCICDGVLASIGTSNLDYRSLYLHFENNVLLYDCDAVTQMKTDFEETLNQCREVTEQYHSRILRIWQCILRLFAPLL